MNEFKPTPQFEENIRQSFGVPAIRKEFAARLHEKIMQRATENSRRPLLFFGSRPAWTAALVILAVMLIITLLVGPQNVAAAVMRLFGYIPGVGIIEETGSLRILAKPAQVTRDGITVSVNQVVLTPSETRLNYGVSGVPLSAYPRQEAVTGCIEKEYLRLPDGSQIDIDEPIPAEVNQATFVLPCIFNTLPGTVPTGWEIPLRFIPAPPDFTILPVIEVTSQPTGNGSQPEETPAFAPHAAITVDGVVETDDGYILLGAIRPNVGEGKWLEVTGIATLRDAAGKKVSYTFPSDVQREEDAAVFARGGATWALQLKGAGVEFPLTIGFSGVVITQIDPQATAAITVDVGATPQPGQVWEINRDIEIAGRIFRLLSISALPDGYSFRVDPGDELSGVSVQIEGYQAAGGGGGGGREGPINTSLIYHELPKGQLKILFSNPLAASPTETWQTTWQPEALREFPSSPGMSNVCWDADTIQDVPPLPAGLDGKVFFTRLNPELQIVAANMDGSQQQVIARGSVRASLSLDGAHLAYTSAEGMVIKDLSTGEETMILGSYGRDVHPSPDGSRVAFVNSGEVFGIFVIDADGRNPKQFSNLGYESIAGWSPDGSHLYYAIPGSGEDGSFLLRSINGATGEIEDLFNLDHSSRKAPMPALSPDGKWIAYRGSDNSSLYMKSMDKSAPARLLLDHPAMAINGIAWEKDGHLLGVSLITSQNQDGEILLFAPDSCEAYRLPELSGELDAVLIP